MSAGCRTCELTAARDGEGVPAWDRIVRTEHWDVVHAYDSSLLGWLVLVCREHRDCIADLTEVEAATLGPLVRAVSIALRDVLGCEKTYVAQFAEHPLHRHVHVHVIARRESLPADRRGPRVFAELGVPDELRVADAAMDRLATDLRSHPLLAAHR